MGSTTVSGGIGDALVAYGYAMSGSSLTACAAVTIVTSTLYVAATKVFSGARFGHVNSIVTPVQNAASAVSTVTTPLTYTS